MAASAGILVADFAPSCWPALGVALAVATLIAIILRRSLAVYAIVAGAFFLLHSLRTTESAGMRLARQLGNEPQALTVLGSVASEPKMSAKGFASFLLRLESIEQRGAHDRLKCDASGAVAGSAGVRKSIAPVRRGGAYRATA